MKDLITELRYCTKPVSGSVGYGEVISKHVDEKPFWPNENRARRSRYPLRIKFRKVFQVNDWQQEKFALYRTGIEFYHGLNYVEPDKRRELQKFK